MQKEFNGSLQRRYHSSKNLVSAEIRTHDLSSSSLPRCSIAAADNFHYSYQPFHCYPKLGPSQVASTQTDHLVAVANQLLFVSLGLCLGLYVKRE